MTTTYGLLSAPGPLQRRSQGIEIDGVVAEPLDVFEPTAAGEDVEGDVQDAVGFVVGEMALEPVEMVIDEGDQPDPARQQEQETDAAGAKARARSPSS